MVQSYTQQHERLAVLQVAAVLHRGALLTNLQDMTEIGHGQHLSHILFAIVLMNAAQYYLQPVQQPQ